MSNYNSNLQDNNTDLQAILDAVNALPEAGGTSSGGVCPTVTIYIDNEVNGMEGLNPDVYILYVVYYSGGNIQTNEAYYLVEGESLILTNVDINKPIILNGECDGILSPNKNLSTSNINFITPTNAQMASDNYDAILFEITNTEPADVAFYTF